MGKSVYHIWPILVKNLTLGVIGNIKISVSDLKLTITMGKYFNGFIWEYNFVEILLRLYLSIYLFINIFASARRLLWP